MKHTFKSIIALLLCLVMLSTTVLTSCDSGDSNIGGTNPPAQSTPTDNSGESNKTEESQPSTNGGGTENTTVLATGVTLNKTTLSLDKGDTEALIATIAPDNTTDKTSTR